MYAPALALVGLSLLARSSAQQFLDHWPMEGGTQQRSNTIRYYASQAPDSRNRATVFEYALGESDLEGHELSVHATPVTTSNRLVVISDFACNVIALPLPEDLPQQPTPVRAAWAPAWTYSGAASDTGLPDPECSSAVADGTKVYFLSRQTRRVFGLETASGVPQPLPWSPAQLDAQAFPPYAARNVVTGLILRNFTLWIPSHQTTAPGVIALDVRDGSMAFVASNNSAAGLNATAAGGKRFTGSVSVPAAAINPQDTSVVFGAAGFAGDPIEYFRSDGAGVAWKSSTFFKISNRTEHPNIVTVTSTTGGSAQNCILIVDTARPTLAGPGLVVDVVDTLTGRKCKQWPAVTPGRVSNKFVAQAAWVSSGAYLRETADNPNPLVFFTTRNANGQGSLTSWVVTHNALVLRDGHLYQGQPAAAPIVLRHAYGIEYHAILFPGPGGMLQAFDPWSLAEGDLHQVNLRRWNDRPDLRIVGPHMAATQGGSAILVARAAGSAKKFKLFLYGVAHAQFGLPQSPSASRTPTPSSTTTGTASRSATRTPTGSTTATAVPQAPAAAAAADAPSSPATVAAGLFGGMFALVAALAAVAALAPATAAARAVRASAAAALRAIAGGGDAPTGAAAPLSSAAAAERLGLLSKSGAR